MSALAEAFFAGGDGMLPILVCSIVALASALRALDDGLRRRAGAEELLSGIERRLRVGDLDGAVRVAERAGGATGRVALAGLRHAREAQGRVTATVASALVEELPSLRRGQGALAATTQLATLFGLLGTMRGLQLGMACSYHGPPMAPERMLARGIAECLGCTAFGLLVSTFSLAVLWIISLRGEARRCELELVGHGTVQRIARTRAPQRC